MSALRGDLVNQHRPELNEKDRVNQLKDNGFETREEYIDTDANTATSSKPFKKQRMVKLCLIFTAMFVLSLIVGITVSAFMGPGSVFVGLGIGAAVGFVLFILPMIVLLITSRR